MIGSIRRHLNEIALEAECFLRSRYPRWVTEVDPKPLRDEIPVFVFHTIEPEPFAEQLEFLHANGYHTVTADELAAFLAGSRKLPRNAVMLTIDDGRSSVWSYGYPLLQRHGCHATVFLIPGYIRHRDGPAHTLPDCWAGTCGRTDLLDRDPELMTWEQIRSLARSGLLDFQSHTLYHHPVASSDAIIGFFHPGQATAAYDLPVPAGFEERVLAGFPAALWGMPLRPSHPLMAGKPRYLEDPELTHACLRHVAERGGGEFFAEPGWRRELNACVRRWQREHPHGGEFEQPEALQAEILWNLTRARELIEERLPGARVRHLCYPYGAGSPLAAQLSREAGYATNFWLVSPLRATNRPGDDPYSCPRLKGDYIFRLPGKNRKPLREIFRAKIARRVQRRPVF